MQRGTCLVHFTVPAVDKNGAELLFSTTPSHGSGNNSSSTDGHSMEDAKIDFVFFFPRGDLQDYALLSQHYWGPGLSAGREDKQSCILDKLA